MSLSAQIVRRLCVPCTPSELAAIMETPVRTVRATLYQLRKQQRVQRLDRRIKNQPGAGRKEYFWMAADVADSGRAG